MSDNGLPQSILGKKDYWDSLYKDELENMMEHGVQPEGWFGEKVIDKVIRYLSENFQLTDPILDIGCGNGETILSLAGLGWKNLTGVDYSEEAVKICQFLFQQHCATGDITAKVMDIMNMKNTDFSTKYRICLDKGTYDAICLNPDIPEQSTYRLQYWKNVHQLVEDGGYFVIVSCNWTAEELVSHAAEYFALKKIIPTTSYMFGGSQGATTSTCVLSKI